MRLIVIGLGGIGTQLLHPLMQYLNYEGKDLFDEIMLLDGDVYEERNASRQYFDSLGKKSEVTAEYYKNLYKLPITYDTEYISRSNIGVYIKNYDVVLSGVDNNATRLLLEEHAEKLDNITIISGGNDYWDGNVVITQKRDGVYTTPKFSGLHPEILSPKDHNPADLSCDSEVKQGEAQLGLVNASVANFMRTTLLGLINNELTIHEVFVNCLTGGTTVKNNPLNEDKLQYEKLGLIRD